MHTGSCLCGTIRFQTRGALRGIIYCHCSQCRKQSGNFVAATASKLADIVIEGEPAIKWYQASETARRGFCGTCGSLLFWKHNERDSISIMAGSFDRPSGLAGESHIFVDDKGDYYEINDGLPQFEQSTQPLKVAQN
jgi:hypothetical protein